VSDHRRALIAILVYNGREVVPPCLESASKLVSKSLGIDVLVLDDCSPEPGWSQDVADLCEKLGLQYYRSPRNLGIPRNMSLALLRAVSGGYHHVALVNSDVVLPANLVDAVVGILDSDSSIASVTPASNNVSIFSLPMESADPRLLEPYHVNTVSNALAEEFGSESVEIPTGVGYCMFIPTRVVRDIGVMDPVFGRGYCEEVDWCQRARAAGYRNVLGLGMFVFHHGGSTTRSAGLLAAGHTTVYAHEAIVDHRYPSYRGEVAAFGDADVLRWMRERSIEAIVTKAAASEGYVLEVSRISVPAPGDPPSIVRLEPEGLQRRAHVTFASLEAQIELGEHELVTELEARFGRPKSCRIRDRGSTADLISLRMAALGVPTTRLTPYTSSV
jgi:GT2 family glycosyltransferase